MANRTWPVLEPRGWQQSPEFFLAFPTRKARRQFYWAREGINRQVRIGRRSSSTVINFSLPEVLSGNKEPSPSVS